MLVHLLGVPAAAETPRALAPMTPGDQIVNGASTQFETSVAALVEAGTGLSLCTGTLIGCETVLTAAHCVCFGNGASCQNNGPDLEDPSNINVFFQHAGLFGVDSIEVPGNYEFGFASDVAILKLSRPVTGIEPSAINTQARLSNGTEGTIVGFGLTRGDRNDDGFKRVGKVETSACVGVPANQHVCWSFTDPVGAIGTDSNTCSGDSGGPLFATVGGNRVVAGVTSGGENANCTTTDFSFDADVFQNRAWIQQQAGNDLGTMACGEFPSFNTITGISGLLQNGDRERRFGLEVPSSTGLLRLALNGTGSNSAVQLYVRRSGEPTTSVFDCRADNNGDACEFTNPAPGTWSILVRRPAGSGEFQATATQFQNGDGEPTDACAPNATTLCIDDQNGDRRFEVEVSYDTALGDGASGDGRAVPLSSLGVDRGGLFWFFAANNPEVLVKVIRGCAVNDHFWIFQSAGTNAGFTMTVTDTVTGAVRTYTNPDGMAAFPIQDTAAFPCS